MTQHYDFIILGGGAAAFAAAIVASEQGVKTAVINDGLPLGGTCVNVGCVPSKYLLEVGFDHFNSSRSRFSSLTPQTSELDFSAATADKNALVAQLRERNYKNVVAGLDFVDVIEGFAKFTSAHEVMVNERTLSADKFLIATGATTFIPPVTGLNQVDYLTNREALELKTLPQSLLIVGAGPLGLEFAQMFAHFGSKVTVLANKDRVLPRAEPEISLALQHYLQQEGITFVTNAQAQQASQSEGGKTITAKVNGETCTFTADQLLIAAGIKPNTHALGLDAVGVSTSDRGFVQTNDTYQTTIEHIWAAGDVTGKMPLETVAAKEGNFAAKNALLGEAHSVNYDQVPHAVFTSPSVASVGPTEEETMERFNACSCRTVSLDVVPKAMAVNDTRGLVKMGLNPQTGAILSVHIVAPHAAEMIHEAVVAIKAGMTVDDLIDTVHVFPTYSEAIKMAAQAYRRDLSKMSCCVE